MDAEHLGSGASRTCSANWRNELLYRITADRTYCLRTGRVNSCISLCKLGDLLLGSFQPKAGTLVTATGFKRRGWSFWTELDGSSADPWLVVIATRSFRPWQGVLDSADVDRVDGAVDDDLVLSFFG